MPCLRQPLCRLVPQAPCGSAPSGTASPALADPARYHRSITLTYWQVRSCISVGVGISSSNSITHSRPLALAPCRHPELVSGLALISPAVPTSAKGFLARSDLGQLLRLAATRALLASEGPGLNYVRRLIYKRRDEVVSGRLGIYYDEENVDPQVGCCCCCCWGGGGEASGVAAALLVAVLTAGTCRRMACVHMARTAAELCALCAASTPHHLLTGKPRIVCAWLLPAPPCRYYRYYRYSPPV